ncbi:hypothetical protein B0H13DRAFT_1586906 [Mycena leptocephala]|nr:hypothetical protein B0H13DRAFT_1586906 [Mycena leptocephala]
MVKIHYNACAGWLQTLQDELVHLTAGAGYRSVIGMMWSILDNDAPQVAADVYANLFKTTQPD